MPPPGLRTLVGRQQELALLLAALDAATEGHGGAELVTGEAGIGKSRLVAELQVQARSRGATVLPGGCFDTAGELIPYGPLVEALRDVTAPPSDADLPLLLEELTDFLLGRHGLQVDPAVSGRFGRARAYELLLDVLTRLSAVEPVVLVVEDLHWVDQSSLDLLVFLARSLDRRRVLLVLTARSDQVPDGVRRALVELVRAQRLHRTALPRLPDEAVADLVEAHERAPLTAPERDQILTRAEGNAFFALELLTSVERTGSLTIPDTVRESVLGRLTTLSTAARRVVRLAATGQQRLASEVLEAAYGQGGDEAERALREAVDEGLLQVLDDGNLGFTHALVRDVVYDHLLPGERRRCHAALALALEHSAQEPSAPELAHHWWHAGDWPRALTAAVRAATAAERSSAWPEAAEHYVHGLELWDRVPDAPERAGCDRVELTVRAADATRWAGRPERALALVTAELDAGPDDERAARLLERGGRYSWELGDTTGALTAYEQASARLAQRPPSAQRANALAARATGLILLGRFAEAVEVCELALTDARAVRATSVEAHALATAGVARAMTGRLDDGIAALRSSLALAGQTDDVEVLCRAYSNLSWVLEQAGRVPEALAASQEGMRATAERGLLHTAGVPLVNNAASQLVLLGRWTEADLLAEDCLTRPGMARFASFLHLLLAETATGRGDLERADRELAAAGAEAGPRSEPQFAGPLHAVAAELALQRGESDTARRHVREGLAVVGDSEHAEAVLRLCWLGARALAEDRSGASGDDALLDRHLQQVRAAGDRLPQVQAWEATLVAELSGLRSDGPDPDAWAAASSRWSALAFPYQQAYADLRRAEALAHRRALSAAVAPLESAIALAQAVGARPLLGAAQALRRRAGLRTPQPQPQPQPAAAPASDQYGLTAREKDVLRALVAGRTNRQIARRLYITEKTTEIHVSRILAKLGVRNRLEAAALAHRRGLVDPPEPLVGTQ